MIKTKPFVILILKQELNYSLFIFFIAAIVAIESGLLIGVKAFIFCFLFIQLVIILINWKIIVVYLKSFGKFNLGDIVKVIAGAPEDYAKVEKGSICSMRKIDTDKAAKDFNEPVGTVLYLVQPSSGEAIEIPERFLLKLKN